MLLETGVGNAGEIDCALGARGDDGPLDAVPRREGLTGADWGETERGSGAGGSVGGGGGETSAILADVSMNLSCW